MSEPDITNVSSPKEATQPGRMAASKSMAFRWRSAIIILAVVVLGSGVFVTHQLLTYGGLFPSIAGSWYGPFATVHADTGKYVTESSLYVVFAMGPGNQITATSSICSTANNVVDKQPPTANVTSPGTINGTHFILPAQRGDVESNLSWAGTYAPDTIHLDFYPNNVPTPRSPYANLQRGCYADFLNTCKVR